MNYSNKDFTGWDLSNRLDMNNLTITGSCFSQEVPNSNILPATLIGTTFINCNLDNVFIPIGNNIVACSVRKFFVQNDGEDWEVSPIDGKPQKPVNDAKFIALGLSTDPKDIPQTKATKIIIAG